MVWRQAKIDHSSARLPFRRLLRLCFRLRLRLRLLVPLRGWEGARAGEASLVTPVFIFVVVVGVILVIIMVVVVLIVVVVIDVSIIGIVVSIVVVTRAPVRSARGP